MPLQQKDSIYYHLLRLLEIFTEKFLRPFWLLVFIILFITFRNWGSIVKPIQHWGIPEYTLVKDYISTIFSFPVVILVLGLILLFKFSSSIKIFLENSLLKGVAALQIDQKKQEQKPLTIGVPESDTDRDVNITTSELNQFRLLDNLLVFNTKTALHWFNLQINHQSTKTNFNNSFNLPTVIINPDVEKDSIFNALLRNDLLENLGDENYKISSKGQKYLAYLGVV